MISISNQLHHIIQFGNISFDRRSNDFNFPTKSVSLFWRSNYYTHSNDVR